MQRIVLLDDHVAVREGVRRLLAAEWPHIEIIPFAQAAELIDFLRTNPADLLVQDWTIPGKEGAGLIREVQELQPGIRTLVYTMHPALSFGVEAIRAGASGYLSKDRPAEELIAAIHRILQGKRYVSEELAEALASAIADPGSRPHEMLSSREMQVLIGLANGRSLSDLSDSLHLSIKTVSTYKARVLEKLEFHSTADLVKYAIRNRLV